MRLAIPLASHLCSAYLHGIGCGQVAVRVGASSVAAPAEPQLAEQAIFGLSIAWDSDACDFSSTKEKRKMAAA